jgi:hypothetical protein
MDKNRFWAIIEASKKKAKGESIDERSAAQLDTLKQELAKLEPEEIVEFQEVWDTVFDEAYDWGLWGAAYILGGGCSDDGFIDFRSWLITQGQTVYENALKDPETLARLVSEDDGMLPSLRDLNTLPGTFGPKRQGRTLVIFLENPSLAQQNRTAKDGPKKGTISNGVFQSYRGNSGANDRTV